MSQCKMRERLRKALAFFLCSMPNPTLSREISYNSNPSNNDGMFAV